MEYNSKLISLQKERILELDSLRGIAAILVVFYHYSDRLFSKFGVDTVMNKFSVPFGHYGVELFFVISGFVIFKSVSNSKGAKDFLLKRGVRLFPTFWVAMFITTIVVMVLGPNSLKVTVSEFLINLTMIPSFFDVKAVDGVYWTLKVEWGFYIVMSLVLMFNTIGRVRLLSLIFSMFLIVFTTVFGFHLYFYYSALFVSGLSFYHLWNGSNKWEEHAVVGQLVILSLISLNVEIVLVTAVLVTTMYLLVFGKLRFLAFQPLLFLGKISYALYLLHQNIGHSIQLLLIDLKINNVLILLLLPLTVSIFLAYVVTYFIEIPLTKKIRSLVFK